MKAAVSACLLGINCKYNGKHNLRSDLLERLKEAEILPVCPETCGNLSCPRTPSEIVNERVLTRDGQDVTSQFDLGAKRVLDQILDFDPDIVYLKSRSPSCGVTSVYDGTFSGRLVPGKGVLAKLLEENGIPMQETD